MNNEIKEILDEMLWQFEKHPIDGDYLLEEKSAKAIYDYITNLQQEIKEANDSVEWWSNRYNAVVKNCDETVKNMIALGEENERLKEANKILEENWKHYMMICGKAIEYIKEKISSTKGVINDYMYHKEHNQHLIELLQEDIEMYKNELNILQNGSDDNE